MAIRYTYESAATELYPDKPGVNRITWEDNGTEDTQLWDQVTKEYMPHDPRSQPSPALAAVLQAKPEEIEQIKMILGIK